MIILGLASVAGLFLLMAGLIGAEVVSSAVISNYFDKEIGSLTSENRRQFEAELDKLAGLLKTREGKQRMAEEGINLEQALLGSVGSQLGPVLPGEDASAASVDDDPLGPTDDLELDEGAILADGLGVSPDQVQKATHIPQPPSIAMFGRGPR